LTAFSKFGKVRLEEFAEHFHQKPLRRWRVWRFCFLARSGHFNPLYISVKQPSIRLPAVWAMALRYRRAKATVQKTAVDEMKGKR
jgi:hypothetical protein